MLSRFHFALPVFFLILLAFASGCKIFAAAGQKILLAEKGKAYFEIELADTSSLPEQFAGSQLSLYLEKICGAQFSVHKEQNHSRPAILLEINRKLRNEEYQISLKNKNLLLEAGSGRAILYAVYDLLHRLGCSWLAPQFSFYDGGSEIIPKKATLFYDASVIISERPQFAYRKLDVEEGLSHDAKNLKQLIDWMPKARFNILMVPLNYQGAGRVQWDNWREELTPELNKRGLLIEVGGHGYQNFLNAKMEEGNLFKEHPEWFGKNKNGEPDARENLVFNTSETGAVNYFISNIESYLRQHPEIDIFDLWPPDVARWAEWPGFDALGTANDRQARLVNEVDSAIKTIRPGLRLEIIAYGQVLLPPKNVTLNPDILVDFCPIDQSFERQIFDPANENNKEYANAVQSWRKQFAGDIALYSYFRKYAWRSLPLVLPHYFQKDLRWYARIPLNGICTYAEPGDWYTYELNHYTLAALCWKTNTSVDSLIRSYCNLRYGRASPTAVAAYASLEKLEPNYSSIPFTSLKTKEAIRTAAEELADREKQIGKALAVEPDKTISMNLNRLLLMLKYASLDLDILEASVSHKPSSDIKAMVQRLVDFLEQNAEAGVFLPGKNSLGKFLKHYKIQ